MKLLSIRKLLSARPEEGPARDRNEIALTDRSVAYLDAAWARLRGYFGPEVPAFAEPLRYLYVNPLEVQLRCGLSYPPDAARPRQRFENYGRIVTNTKWERGARLVYVYSLAECLQRRFIDGLSWEKSGVIDLKLKEIERAGRSIDGALDRKDLLKRYERVDRLFDDIQKRGFKRQVDLEPPVSLSNELFISIGRSGRTYFSNGGNHRLFIAQILRLEKIPFLVMARDEAWVKRVLQSRDQPASPLRRHPEWGNSLCPAEQDDFR